jgi:hypothetical protein
LYNCTIIVNKQNVVFTGFFEIGQFYYLIGLDGNIVGAIRNNYPNFLKMANTGKKTQIVYGNPKYIMRYDNRFQNPDGTLSFYVGEPEIKEELKKGKLVRTATDKGLIYKTREKTLMIPTPEEREREKEKKNESKEKKSIPDPDEDPIDFGFMALATEIDDALREFGKWTKSKLSEAWDWISGAPEDEYNARYKVLQDKIEKLKDAKKGGTDIESRKKKEETIKLYETMLENLKDEYIEKKDIKVKKIHKEQNEKEKENYKKKAKTADDIDEETEDLSESGSESEEEEGTAYIFTYKEEIDIEITHKDNGVSHIK